MDGKICPKFEFKISRPTPLTIGAGEYTLDLRIVFFFPCLKVRHRERQISLRKKCPYSGFF